MPQWALGQTNVDSSDTVLERELAAIESEYARIFSLSAPIRYEVRSLSVDEFEKIAGPTENPLAAFFKDGVLYLKRKESGEIPARTLRHELAHAMIRSISTTRPPAWLDEGLAQYLEGIPLSEQSRYRRELRLASDAGQLFSLHELSDGFGALPESLQRIAYAQSFFYTRELIFKGGVGKLREFLLSDGRNEDLVSIFGFDTDALVGALLASE